VLVLAPERVLVSALERVLVLAPVRALVSAPVRALFLALERALERALVSAPVRALVSALVSAPERALVLALAPERVGFLLQLAEAAVQRNLGRHRLARFHQPRFHQHCRDGTAPAGKQSDSTNGYVSHGDNACRVARPTPVGRSTITRPPKQERVWQRVLLSAWEFSPPSQRDILLIQQHGKRRPVTHYETTLFSTLDVWPI